MQYNFSKLTNRFNSNSLKWNVTEDELPMWVADMDFETAPEIIRAINNKVNLGIYGYTVVSDDYYKAIIKWWDKRHNFNIKKEWILFCTGVVPAISSIVRHVTNKGDNIVIQSPVYNIFYNSILNNGRNVLSSDLYFDGNNYEIDFIDLEEKLSNPLTTLMIICNPHNPVGKLWSRDELKKIGELCLKHNVLLLSDEIHCDLTLKGKRYTPMASVSSDIAENTITCIAPTKTFNLAGLQTSSIIIPNENIRKKVNRGINTDEVAEPNAFAIEATISAFTYGEKWLDNLLRYIEGNKELVELFIKVELPNLKIINSYATYLLWIDCSSITDDTVDLCNYIRAKTGLYLSNGSIYGENGKGFIRINIACPTQRLEDALYRLKAGIENYIVNSYK